MQNMSYQIIVIAHGSLSAPFWHLVFWVARVA